VVRALRQDQRAPAPFRTGGGKGRARGLGIQLVGELDRDAEVEGFVELEGVLDRLPHV
jgi:hypothetical protein